MKAKLNNEFESPNLKSLNKLENNKISQDCKKSASFILSLTAGRALE